jgi:hypothetical protein
MEYAEVLMKIYASSECDLLIMLKNYREERKSAILNFAFFFVRNFIITAFVVVAALLAITAPFGIFIEWLGHEFGLLLGFPIMAFLIWVICTHDKLEAFLKNIGTKVEAGAMSGNFVPLPSRQSTIGFEDLSK